MNTDTLNAELLSNAPALYTEQAHPSKSSRYAYIDSISVIRSLIDTGWEVKGASQARVRNRENAPYANHLVRLTHPELKKYTAESRHGGVSTAELIFENNHGIAGKGRLMMGFYEFACANKVIIGNTETSYCFSHQNITMNDIVQQVFTMLTRYPEFVENRERLRQTIVHAAKAIEFTERWLDIRTRDINQDNFKILTTASELSKPKRVQDTEGTLWSLLNIVQEKLINGDVRVQGINKEMSSFGKINKMKKLSGFKRIIDLNTEMWETLV